MGEAEGAVGGRAEGAVGGRAELLRRHGGCSVEIRIHGLQGGAAVLAGHAQEQIDGE